MTRDRPALSARRWASTGRELVSHSSEGEPTLCKWTVGEGRGPQAQEWVVGSRWPGPGTARATPGPPVVSGGRCGRGFWVSGRASAGARGGVALTLGSALLKEISGRRAACRRVEPLEDSKSWVAHHRTWQGPGQSLGGRLMGCVPPPGCPRAAGRLCVHAVQLHADVTVGTWGVFAPVGLGPSPLLRGGVGYEIGRRSDSICWRLSCRKKGRKTN